MEGSDILEDVEDIQDKVLRTIEEGDATDILTEAYAESFNELMKYELIEINEDKVRLTDKGRQALSFGVANVLKQAPVSKEKLQVTDFPQPDSRNRSFFVLLIFLLSSLSAMILWLMI